MALLKREGCGQTDWMHKLILAFTVCITLHNQIVFFAVCFWVVVVFIFFLLLLLFFVCFLCIFFFFFFFFFCLLVVVFFFFLPKSTYIFSDFIIKTCHGYILI